MFLTFAWVRVLRGRAGAVCSVIQQLLSRVVSLRFDAGVCFGLAPIPASRSVGLFTGSEGRRRRRLSSASLLASCSVVQAGQCSDRPDSAPPLVVPSLIHPVWRIVLVAALMRGEAALRHLWRSCHRQRRGPQTQSACRDGCETSSA